MIHAIADTHALLWHLFDSVRLSKTAAAEFDFACHNGMMIGLSAISLVEIVYLIEKQRIPKDALPLLAGKLKQPETLFELIPVTHDIAENVANVPYHQVPDMPDRIIAATALYHQVPLISRDRKIKLSDIETIW